MDISKAEKLAAVFSNGDDSLGDVAAGMLLGKLKGGGDSGDNSGCGCAIFLILVLFGIVLFYFLQNT